MHIKEIVLWIDYLVKSGRLRKPKKLHFQIILENNGHDDKLTSLVNMN